MQSSFLRMSFFPLAVVSAIALGESQARAQLPEAMKFKTIFPFVVGNTELPAGTYTIQRLGDEQFVYEVKGQKSVLLQTNLVSDAPPTVLNPDKGEVIFQRVGDTLVMQEVWDPIDGTGIMSTMKFKGAEAAKDRAGRVAENVPATVIVPLVGATN
jgi:hypothetical protein